MKTQPNPNSTTKGYVLEKTTRTVKRTVSGAPWGNGDGFGWHELGNGLYVRGEALA